MPPRGGTAWCLALVRVSFCRLFLPYGGGALASRGLALGGGAEAGDPADRLPDLLGGNQPGAFELPRRPGMARTPQEIVVVEAVVRVVPAAVAGVVVDDPVGRRELVVAAVKPLIKTTGMSIAQASHDRPLDNPTKNSACFNQRARSRSGRSPVSSSTPCGMWYNGPDLILYHIKSMY